MNLCVHPFLLAAVFMRRRQSLWMYLEKYLSLKETLFSFAKSTFVEQMEMYS